MSPREALIALNMLPKIGPVMVRKLTDFLGSPELVFSANRDQLMKVEGLGPRMAEIISDWESRVDLSGEMAAAGSRGLKIITQLDSAYPAPFWATYDPPLVLYVWGDLHEIDNRGIGVVGSRNFTPYGQRCARRLSFQLAQRGVTVVSGLARGIDTFSHEGALAAGGRTIAVIGSGMGQIYPPENMVLAEKIAAGNGAVVSEFALDTKPDKRSFPRRNRIVAGWSEGVLVIECPEWSGSLITANLANEMGKMVYAVPGPIDSPQSAGTNELIRNGATLIRSADEILADNELLPNIQEPGNPSDSEVKSPLGKLSETEQAIFDTLGAEPLMMDQICAVSGLPLPQISVSLLQLEVKKLVCQLPGQRYIRR